MGSVVSGLQAALLFARGRSEGLRYLEPDQAGAARSFWALPLTMPAIVCLRLMDWVQSTPPAHAGPVHAGHVLGMDLMGFIVGWLAYALLTYHVLRSIGVGDRWPRFVAAWNWCNVIENLLLVFGSIPGLLGTPAVVGEAVQLIAIGWALWIEWFAIRQALQTTVLVAVWLVVLDQAVGLVLATLTLQMMPG